MRFRAISDIGEKARHIRISNKKAEEAEKILEQELLVIKAQRKDKLQKQKFEQLLADTNRQIENTIRVSGVKC